MVKYLTAREKAEELGITTNGLAKTRHLYKHIKKSPRKYLYFKEDPREAVRPNMVGAPFTTDNSSTPRKHRRRNVPHGEENYHKMPGGSGVKAKVLNQMRAKASLEGLGTPEEIKSMTSAMSINIKENHKNIVEQEQNRKRTEWAREEERMRKKDPSRYGGMIRGNNRGRLVDFTTTWKEVFSTPKTEYDEALEDLKDTPKNKYYY